MRKLAFVVALLVAFPTAAYANVTEEDFVLDTTRDLVALCSVDASDPNAMAAIHMCHGYFTGIIHFHKLMGEALEGHVFCMKAKGEPTRNQAVAMMVEWSSAHPEHNSMEAIDGVLRWAADTYPCE